MTRDRARRRFPSWVYGSGTEPDPRFTLANERTLLAWVRTALAFIAAGVALRALPLPLQAGYRTAASIVLLGAGLVTAPAAYLSWATTELAMRTSRPLPAAPATALAATAVLFAAVLVLIGVLLQ